MMTPMYLRSVVLRSFAIEKFRKSKPCAPSLVPTRKNSCRGNPNGVVIPVEGGTVWSPWARGRPWCPRIRSCQTKLERLSNSQLGRIKDELRFWLASAPFGMPCNETNADRRSASRTGGQDFGNAVSLLGAMRSTSEEFCADSFISSRL